MVLGERIKRIRTFRGLTQRELGLKLDMRSVMLMFVSHSMNLAIVFPKTTL